MGCLEIIFSNGELLMFFIQIPSLANEESN
jgi:hypothetical protein